MLCVSSLSRPLLGRASRSYPIRLGITLIPEYMKECGSPLCLEGLLGAWLAISRVLLGLMLAWLFGGKLADGQVSVWLSIGWIPVLSIPTEL